MPAKNEKYLIEINDIINFFDKGLSFNNEKWKNLSCVYRIYFDFYDVFYYIGETTNYENRIFAHMYHLWCAYKGLKDNVNWDYKGNDMKSAFKAEANIFKNKSQAEQMKCLKKYSKARKNLISDLTRDNLKHIKLEIKYIKMIKYLDIRGLGISNIKFEILNSKPMSDKERFDEESNQIKKNNFAAYTYGFNAPAVIESDNSNHKNRFTPSQNEEIWNLSKSMLSRDSTFGKWNCVINLWLIFKSLSSKERNYWYRDKIDLNNKFIFNQELILLDSLIDYGNYKDFDKKKFLLIFKERFNSICCQLPYGYRDWRNYSVAEQFFLEQNKLNVEQDKKIYKQIHSFFKQIEKASKKSFSNSYRSELDLKMMTIVEYSAIQSLSIRKKYKVFKDLSSLINLENSRIIEQQVARHFLHIVATTPELLNMLNTKKDD